MRSAGTLPAAGALVAATAIWGSTFIVTKQSLPGMSPEGFLTWRFGIAAVVLVAVRPHRILTLAPTDRRRGLLLGLLLGSGFLLQTTGLQNTDAGVSGFLTGTAVILTPVVAAVFFSDRVGRAGWIAVGLSAAGVALLAQAGPTSLSTGAMLTLGGAVCFAGHIAGLSQWASPGNAYGLTAWSVAVATLLSGTAALVGRGLTVPPTVTTWQAVAYLALAATCLGFVVQAWAQSALSATTAAVVMTMEPVFAAFLAATIGGEALHATGWLGGVLVVTSMFVAELGPRDCCDALAPRIECC
jgi:drug/metabolite transporter (DMT)-like permease